ncbi:uncharacterized protein LOC108104689 [Drosophila eugracilis]|uniref:uncharacterized protein LOC108104689 n=1 Tax=Drosophila eugracilis TaxID=29029 RepID=UPI0007E88F53|nr:uncharacterized protein LOC108104689 [Drosophila eugracilis]
MHSISSGVSDWSSGSETKSSDCSDLDGSDPYGGFEASSSKSSIVTSDVLLEHNKLPVGWEERIAPITKESYFYDTNTQKVYFRLPSSAYKLASKDWSSNFGERSECNYGCILRCRHILVKHNESDTCSSYRTGFVKLTKTEALERISHARYQITTGKFQFANLAKAISDCCSARHGGDLGPFKLTQTGSVFEKQVLRLNINELSDIFESRAGYHILLRTPVKKEEKPRRPRKQSYDSEKNNLKIHEKETETTSKDSLESDICNFLRKSQRNRDSECEYSRPSIDMSLWSHEVKSELRIYSQQQHKIKKKIFMKKFDVSMCMENCDNLIYVDALGSSVMKL